MATPDELLDELMKNYKKPEDLIGENGLLKQLTKALVERAMKAEMTEHLGFEKHDPAGKNSGNSRNGSSKKTIKGEFGNIDIAVPRDRNSTFEPVIVPKGETGLAATRRFPSPGGTTGNASFRFFLIRLTSGRPSTPRTRSSLSICRFGRSPRIGAPSRTMRP